MYKIDLTGTLEVRVNKGDKPSEIIRKCISTDKERFFYGVLDGIRNVIIYRKCDDCKCIGAGCDDCPFSGTVGTDSRRDTQDTATFTSWTAEREEGENDR